MRGPDNPSGLASADEGWVADRIAAALGALSPVAMYGSLASGADILCAEAATARRIPLHVFLPMGIADFLAASVTPAGANWQARFAALIGQASTVNQIAASADPFASCAAAAMQATCDLAALNGATPVQLAVWNGQVATHAAGTFADIQAWRARHLRSYVISVAAEREE